MERTKLTREENYERIQLLRKLKVSHYIAEKKTPIIVFKESSEDPDFVTIKKDVYEDRKDRFSSRINGMIDYVTSEEVCRNRILLNYFGERNYHDCCVCDVCLNRKTKTMSVSLFKKIEHDIRIKLNEKPLDIEEIADALEYPKEHVIETIRFLIDEEYIEEIEGKLKYK